MSDIRKRTGEKGTTYQVRYASKATKTGYAYATFDTLKAARDFIESGKARKAQGIVGSRIKSVEDAIDQWLDVCEKEGRGDREPVSPGTLEHYRWRARAMKSYAGLCRADEQSSKILHN